MGAKKLEEPKGAELRTAPRRELDGKEPGAMRLAGSGRRISYSGVDISRGGIGIVTTEAIGEVSVVLEVDGAWVELELVWTGASADGAVKRYGFRVKDQAVDLNALVNNT